MYFEFMLKSFRSKTVYKTNTVMQIFSSFIFLFVSVSVWTALYATTNGTVNGIDLKKMLTYVMLLEIFHAVVRLPVARYIAGRVTSGIISIDYIRPIDLKYTAIATALGEALFQVIFFVAPILVLGSIMWGFVLPVSLLQWLLFGISLILAIYLYATIEYTFGLTAFWTKTDFHINWVIGSFMKIFSGIAIPLWFYPSGLKQVADYMPFKYIVFEPINIFLGQIGYRESLMVIVAQLIWLAVLLVLERIIWYFAQQVITVQGG